MWTDNGKRLINKNLAGNVTGMAIDFIDVNGDVVNQNYNAIVAGVVGNANYYVSDITAFGNNQAALKYALYVGTGTKPPTEDDISLEIPVVFDCVQNPSITMGSDGKNILITYVLQNNTGETHTITEIGLCAYVVSSTSTHNVLFNRKLLDVPVTIANGESYAFSFSWNTNEVAE